MVLLGILLMVGVIALVVIEIFFLIQLTEVGINILGPEQGGFMDLGNPFAWILVFIIMAIIALLIRLVFRVVNALVSIIVGGLISLLFLKRAEEAFLPSVTVVSLLVWVFWLIACIPLTGLAMGYFGSNPELNSWLAEGNWLAQVLVYLGIFGLVCPDRSND